MSARRLDGARQYFTRAYDFGFTRSLDETFRLWPREVLLEDAIRVVRRFRPQVVFATFTGTERDGHGQHQASGVIAREVFQAAGDPAVAPQLTGEGLTPWKPTTLVRSNWFDRGSGFPLPTGDVEPLTGRSYQQIAMASRSLHRSQDMGMLQPPGPGQTGAVWEQGGAGKDATELFAGVDTRLRSIVADVRRPGAPGAGRGDPRPGRGEGDRDAAPAEPGRARRRRAFDRRDAGGPPRRAGSGASGGRRRAHDPRRKDRRGRSGAGGRRGRHPRRHRGEARRRAPEKPSPRPSASGTRERGPSPSRRSRSRARTAGPSRVSPRRARPSSRACCPSGSSPRRPRPTRRRHSPTFSPDPCRAPSTTGAPWPRRSAGEPFQPPPLTAVARLRVGDASIRLAREVTFRIRDEAVGEIRHPLRVVPRLDVAVDPTLLVWPLDQSAPRRLRVTLTSNCAAPVTGTVEAVLPPGWPAAAPVAFALAKKGDRALVQVPLAPPRRPGSRALRRGRGRRHVGRGTLHDGHPAHRLRAHPSHGATRGRAWSA